MYGWWKCEWILLGGISDLLNSTTGNSHLRMSKEKQRISDLKLISEILWENKIKTIFSLIVCKSGILKIDMIKMVKAYSEVQKDIKMTSQLVSNIELWKNDEMWKLRKLS